MVSGQECCLKAVEWENINNNAKEEYISFRTYLVWCGLQIDLTCSYVFVILMVRTHIVSL